MPAAIVSSPVRRATASRSRATSPGSSLSQPPRFSSPRTVKRSQATSRRPPPGSGNDSSTPRGVEVHDRHVRGRAVAGIRHVGHQVPVAVGVHRQLPRRLREAAPARPGGDHHDRRGRRSRRARPPAPGRPRPPAPRCARPAAARGPPAATAASVTACGTVATKGKRSGSRSKCTSPSTRSRVRARPSGMRTASARIRSVAPDASSAASTGACTPIAREPPPGAGAPLEHRDIQPAPCQLGGDQQPGRARADDDRRRDRRRSSRARSGRPDCRARARNGTGVETDQPAGSASRSSPGV